MNERFTGTQIFYLKRLINGPVSLDEYRKWDQRPLRGLFLRGHFEFQQDLSIYATNSGWAAYKQVTVKYRKNWVAPIFRHKGRRFQKVG